LTTDSKLYRHNGTSFVATVPTTDLTGTVSTAQIADAAINTAKFASGITPVEIVGTLPVSANFAGRTVFLTTDSKLYRHNGTSFVATVPTTDLTGTVSTAQIADAAINTAKIADAAINTAKFASGITPIEIVATLPVTGNFAGRTVFLTTDSKTYRFNGTSFVASVPTTDLTGTITSAQIADAAVSTAKFASGITPVEIVGTLPASGNFAGRTVFLTTDSKTYRHNGTSFISTTAATDVTGQLTTTQITDDAITTAKIAANAITSNEIAANAIVAGKVAAGAISTTELAANAVTAAKIAADTITAAQIAAGTITSAEIAADTITAANIAANAITSSEIAANAIVAGKVAAGAITATEIASRAITASKIAITDSTNYVLDPTYEDASYWTFGSGWGVSTDAVATAVTALDSARVMKSPTGNGTTSQPTTATPLNGVDRYFELTPGAQYRLAFDAMVLSGFTGHARIEIYWYQGNKTTSSSPTNTPVSATDFRTTAAVADTIFNMTAQVTAPADAKWGMIRHVVYWSTTQNNAGVSYFARPSLRRMANGELIVDGAITAVKIAANTITSAQIAADTITANEIAANAITSAELAANSVIAGKVQAGAISTAELAANAVTAAKIAANTITAAQIAANTITASQIAGDTITAAQIATNAITSNELAANSVIAGKVQAGAISTAELAANAVTAAKIAANTITAAQIAAGTITSAEIAADTITAANIAANAITASELAANSVVAGKVAAGAITATEIASRAITASKIAITDSTNYVLDPTYEDASYWTLGSGWGVSTDAVATAVTALDSARVMKSPTGNGTTSQPTTATPLNGVDRYFELTPGAQYRLAFDAMVLSGFTGHARIEIYWYQGNKTTSSSPTNTPVSATDFRTTAAVADTVFQITQQVTPPADAKWGMIRHVVYWSTTQNNAGAVYFARPSLRRMANGELIVDGAITAVKIAANTITAAQIAADTITSGQIATNAITSNELAANSVIAGKVQAGAISTAELAANAVTAAKIAANTITAAQIAANTITASQIAGDTITAAQIATNAITSNELAANSVIAGKVQAGAISTAELAANAVTAAKIAANTITAAQIAANTITASQIAGDTITAAQIATNAITASELAANSVVAGKIAAAAVSTTELAANAVIASKLGITDLSNLIQDPNFQDASYWTLGSGWVIGTTQALNMSALNTLATPAGNGTLSQAATQSELPPAVWPSVETLKEYRVAVRTRVTAAFTGRLRMIVDWYRRDKTTLLSSSTITIVDRRTTLGAAVNINGSQIFAAPADAVFVNFDMVVDWSTTQVNGGNAYFAMPTINRAANGELVVDGAITALKLNVAELSAITADLGTVTAGLIRSGVSGMTLDLDNNRLRSGNYVADTSGFELDGNSGVLKAYEVEVAGGTSSKFPFETAFGTIQDDVLSDEGIANCSLPLSLTNHAWLNVYGSVKRTATSIEYNLQAQHTTNAMKYVTATFPRGLGIPWAPCTKFLHESSDGTARWNFYLHIDADGKMWALRCVTNGGGASTTHDLIADFLNEADADPMFRNAVYVSTKIWAWKHVLMSGIRRIAVPATVSVSGTPTPVTGMRVWMWGAAGQRGAPASTKGGPGGYVKFDHAVVPGEILSLLVGGYEGAGFGGVSPGRYDDIAERGSEDLDNQGGGGSFIARGKFTRANLLGVAGGGGAANNSDGGCGGSATGKGGGNGSSSTLLDRCMGVSDKGATIQPGGANSGGGGYEGGGQNLTGTTGSAGKGGTNFVIGTATSVTNSATAENVNGTPTAFTPPGTGEAAYTANQTYNWSRSNVGTASNNVGRSGPGLICIQWLT
jgi:hypothetical protein